MTTTGSGWRAALGDARLLVSGFGRWGGGLYDLTSGAPVALDDLATSGIAVGGGRLWRVLRAPGEQTSTCELLSYDARGVRSYQRIDAVRDPHDVVWFEGAPHVSASWDDAVWRVDPTGDVHLVWRGSAVPDGWHVNSLLVVDGALHVCAFGRFDRHKGWKSDERAGAGFVLDVATGREVLGGLAHPHTPRRRGDRWYVCESTHGTLTELDAAGTVLRQAPVRRFTRGLALVGPYALVGGNAHRSQDHDRAEIAVVDLRLFTVVDRIPMPCLEVYDILPVSPAVVRGAAAGFGANASRAVDQHRTAGRPPERRPTPDDAAVRMVAPRAAAILAAAGEALPDDRARACGVRGALDARATAGTAPTVTVEVVNRSGGPLASVVPRPVKVGARWIPAAGGDTIANPLVPLPRVLPDMASTRVEVPLEVPDEPGRYEVRIALRQRGRGWFGVRLQADVEVVAAAAVEVEAAGSVCLGAQRREEHDVANAGRVGEQHDQPVHADAEAAGGR
jgi:uncharacterized protein (TIGR03032 family)